MAGRAARGSSGRKQVLIAEHDQSTRAVKTEILRDEGFAAASTDRPQDVVAEVRAQQPDLVVVGLPPRPADAMRVLDDLREDPVAVAVPELTTATFQPADAAKASFTVQEAIEKPFDLDDLVARVQSALERPPLHADLPSDAEPEGPRADAERVLAQGSRQALLRFADRLRQDPTWQGLADANLADVLGAAPTVVEAVDVAMHYPEPTDLLEEHPTAAARLRAHADGRLAQGLPVEALVREYDLLREELQSLLADGLSEKVDSEGVLAIARLVDDVLDQIQAASVPSTEPSEPGAAVVLSADASADPGPP
jgi:CheY-like chemotaxis protein